MGTTPAKTFPMPQPFGASPAANNVSQVTPYQQVSGPGFAAISGFDQTQQQPQQPSTAQLFSPTLAKFRANGGFGFNSRVGGLME